MIVFCVIMAFFLPYSYYLIQGGLSFLLDYFISPINPELANMFIERFFIFDTITCLVMLFLYLPMYLFWKKKFDIAKYEPRKFSKNHLIMSIILAFGCAGMSTIILNTIDLLSSLNIAPTEIVDSMQNFNDTWSDVADEKYIWVFLSVVILGPIVEEILFRGLEYNVIQKVTKNTYLTIFVSGLAFGIWHLEMVQVIYTAIMGMILSIVYRYTKTLLPVIIIHVINNFMSALPPVMENDFVFKTINVLEMVCLIPALVIVFTLLRKIVEEEKIKKIEESVNFENYYIEKADI